MCLIAEQAEVIIAIFVLLFRFNNCASSPNLCQKPNQLWKRRFFALTK
jgi:hypothetical protein